MSMRAGNLCWVAVVTSLVLAGCAVGNTHTHHSILANPKISGSGQVSVATHDRRPYVLSGDKQPQFVGLSRGGFGNPFDVRTNGGRPLADDMTEAIANSLKLKGFEPGGSRSMRRSERIAIVAAEMVHLGGVGTLP